MSFQLEFIFYVAWDIRVIQQKLHSPYAKIQSFVEISTVPRLSRKLRVRSEPSNFLSNSGIDVSVVRQKILLQVVPHAVSDSE